MLQVVADKTGYPSDMLDLELDLEADLGIDTVKQAEVFASIRETFDIPRDDNIKLRDYPTLNHVIGFVRDRANLPAPAVQAAPVPAGAVPVPAVPVPAAAAFVPAQAAPPAAPVSDPVTAKVLQVVADKTGYPSDMLDLELDLEADLGIDTVKQAEIFAASARPSTSRATRTSNCATTRPSTTSSDSSATAPTCAAGRPQAAPVPAGAVPVPAVPVPAAAAFVPAQAAPPAAPASDPVTDQVLPSRRRQDRLPV